MRLNGCFGSSSTLSRRAGWVRSSFVAKTSLRRRELPSRANIRLMQCSKQNCYSITSSVPIKNDSEIVGPSAFAVLNSPTRGQVPAEPAKLALAALRREISRLRATTNFAGMKNSASVLSAPAHARQSNSSK
jgi:hypothetical protein